jgi:predicted metal-dependent hydrolase
MGRDASRRARGTPLVMDQLELPLAAKSVQYTAMGESIHAIHLGKRILTYRFRRAARKTIGISIGKDGLAATAPRWVAITEVEAFIREKERWIIEKLVEAATAIRNRVQWAPGVRIPLLGRDTRIEPGAPGSAPRLDGGVLRLPTESNDGEPLRAGLIQWMKHAGLSLFAQRANELAPRLGVPFPRVRISNAKTQWGHCTQSVIGDARVYLHWRLMHFEQRIIDYVVVHELAHIREMNHSDRFWDLVSTLCPDHREIRKEIDVRSRALPEL